MISEGTKWFVGSWTITGNHSYPEPLVLLICMGVPVSWIQLAIL